MRLLVQVLPPGHDGGSVDRYPGSLPGRWVATAFISAVPGPRVCAVVAGIGPAPRSHTALHFVPVPGVLSFLDSFVALIPEPTATLGAFPSTNYLIAVSCMPCFGCTWLWPPTVKNGNSHFKCSFLCFLLERCFGCA